MLIFSGGIGSLVTTILFGLTVRTPNTVATKENMVSTNSGRLAFPSAISLIDMEKTTNFYRGHGFRGAWENLKVVERLTRRDASTINYRFTVEDPTTFTTPFTGELVFTAMPAGEEIYEYACHEANYGLEGVLRGARAQEAEAAKKKP